MRGQQFALPVILLAACASPPDSMRDSPPNDPLQAEGRYLAEVHCASCHAIARSDSSAHPEAPPLRRLSRSYPVSALEESLAEGIMVGHPDMPEYRFRPEDVSALIAWLESIQDSGAR